MCRVRIGYVFSALFLITFTLNWLCVISTHDWDILIFTQHWPITVCMQWKEKQEQHTCSLPRKDVWTVHGIWPSKLGSYGPNFCNKSMHFDPTKLEFIEDKLLNFWPDVYNGTNPYSLWKHEWTKHGTCAATLEALDTEAKYFEQGLQWINTYSMENILSYAGINPDTKSYTPQEVWDAVKGAVGKKPVIECVKDEKNEEWYLFEVRLCFNKTLDLIDCSLGTGIKTNCPLSQPISYPGYVPTDENKITPHPQYFRAPWLLQALQIIKWLQWMTL